MKKLMITTTTHPRGAKRWANKVLEPRLVAVPENAKTHDLRSKGVELINRGPALVFWASGHQSSRFQKMEIYVREFQAQARKLAADRPDQYSYEDTADVDEM